MSGSELSQEADTDYSVKKSKNKPAKHTTVDPLAKLRDRLKIGHKAHKTKKKPERHSKGIWIPSGYRQALSTSSHS